MDEYLSHINKIFKTRSNRRKAHWLENYVKHNIRSLGVGIPDIREIVKEVREEYDITALKFDEQAEFLELLMKQIYTEHKIAAIIYLQIYHKNTEPGKLLKLISGWFDKGYITDWNVCDWMCVRILTPMIDTDAKTVLPELKKWNASENLWKARASLVSFAQCKTINQHKQVIYEFSSVLIQREERFSKTAVGWVMRELSKENKRFVEDFLMKFQDYTTNEVIDNSMKYFDK